MTFREVNSLTEVDIPYDLNVDLNPVDSCENLAKLHQSNTTVTVSGFLSCPSSFSTPLDSRVSLGHRPESTRALETLFVSWRLPRGRRVPCLALKEQSQRGKTCMFLCSAHAFVFHVP